MTDEPPPRGRGAAPLVFRGCIDNAPEVRRALALAAASVLGAHPTERELWHLGLAWHQAAVDARAACAHVFAELYRDADLVCCANGLSPRAGGGGWRGYLALEEDAEGEIAPGDLVLWRASAPRLPAGALPVEMRPRASLTGLCLARLRRAWHERRAARFGRDGVEVLPFAPRVHGVGGARRLRQLQPLLAPPRLDAGGRRLFGVA